MNEDIMKQVVRVAASAEEDQRKMAIEAYINSVCSNLAANARGDMITSTIGVPPIAKEFLETWSDQNRAHVSLQISEVARYILRKELLGE